MSKTILTADDSKVIRMMLKNALKPLDYNVVEATNGSEALEATKNHNPDLIILDITMPDMNGLDVLNELRNERDSESTPVVMLTAESDAESIDRAKSLNVSGYIPKPFKMEKVTSTVSEIIG